MTEGVCINCGTAWDSVKLLKKLQTDNAQLRAALKAAPNLNDGLKDEPTPGGYHVRAQWVLEVYMPWFWEYYVRERDDVFTAQQQRITELEGELRIERIKGSHTNCAGIELRLDTELARLRSTLERIQVETFEPETEQKCAQALHPKGTGERNG